ncbi:MAG: acyl-CoA dehydrogenase family protein [Halioglobus sp.]|nr:acyl-CoA dehydrogenase family protein [Halioglobus sp.]
MNTGFSAEELAFQSEVRAFLRDYRNVDGFYCQGHQWPQVRALFAAMAEKNWLALSWPREHGGLGKGPVFEYILWNEVAYARAARNPLAAGIVAHTIIRHGTPAQQQTWLPRIRSGEVHFSLCYSEPEAGSDLAALRLRADRSRAGSHYVLNGQKCWQSYAQDMDYLWVLARSGTQDSRGRGLSLFICDKQTLGITVSPLPTVDGDQLNEVFFDSVEIPLDQRIGEENGAWPIVGEALADERHIQFPPGRLRRDLEELVAWLNSHDLGNDPVVRHRMANLTAQVMEAEALGLKVLEAMVRGRNAAVDAAMNKVIHTVTCQDIARAVLDFGGPEALVSGCRPELIWRQSLTETIGGGTTEIMRSMVARQLLGLSA